MSLFKNNKQRSQRGNASRITNRTLGAESLESRQLMAAHSINFSPDIDFDSRTGTVEIEGSVYADSASIRYQTFNNSDPADDQTVVTVTANGRAHKETYPRYDSQGFPRVVKIEFDGGAGNDRFFNYTDIASQAHGGTGDDWLIGGSNEDRMFGESGHDWISGRGGEDELDGGTENDVIAGGDQDDVIRGASGDDTLSGGYGIDQIWGGPDDDMIDGGHGPDVLRGESGHDDLDGNHGDDDLVGGSGNDSLRGSDGNDLLLGGSGNDHIWGGNGNDTLLGDEDVDRLYGQQGDDFLYGGDDSDTLFGGSDDDMMFGGNGRDYLYGGTGTDRLGGGELEGLDLNDPFYGSPAFTKGVANDVNTDHLYGGTDQDIFYIADNYFWSWGHLDVVHNPEPDEVIIDVDPDWPLQFDEGGLPPWSAHGHHFNG